MKASIHAEMKSEPISITADVSLGDAQEVMRTWGMRHLPVIDNNRLVGIISERDIYRAHSLQIPDSTEIRDVMSKNPYHVQADVTVAEVVKVMADQKFGCTIITDRREQVIGIFTTTDALHLLHRVLSEPTAVDARALQLKEYLAQQRRAAK